ncbi:MAG: CBS domain-containing protein [Lactobacillales bacterium]|jgi:predicted transcriptional regulator|nr:CBS domain-containing protein [Lactobacillales bacterium]
MIGKSIEELMLENKETFLIPADNVANVMVRNPLNHALLVLSQVGYSKIPVLDKGDRYVGLIGLADIVDKLLDLPTLDLNELKEFTVADVMDVGVPTVKPDVLLEDILHLLVDQPFLPVVDDAGCFKGIITRKAVLKAVNFTFHELEKRNLVFARKGLTEPEELLDLEIV